MRRDRVVEGMRAYWDEKARVNAAWYVDTTLDFDDPDMDRFFAAADGIVAEAVDDAPVQPSGRGLAVEIGSGLGRICRALSSQFDQVIGVDISPTMVDRARELVPDAGVEFRLGSGSSLDVVDTGTADLVLSFTVFQHIPDRQVVEGYLAEAARVLRPGGILVFQWNNQAHARWWGARRALLRWVRRWGIARERYDRNAPQFLGSRIAWSHIEAALQRNGLEPVARKGEGTLFAWAWARRRDPAP